MTGSVATAPATAPEDGSLTDNARGAYERRTASLRASRPAPAVGWSPPFENIGPRVQSAWLDVARPDAERIAKLTAGLDELRAALSSLTDRAEASQAITEDEADEYRKLTENGGGS